MLRYKKVQFLKPKNFGFWWVFKMYLCKILELVQTLPAANTSINTEK